jgi:TRAP-type C4-dicarboxylate transport system permease small subunit
VCGSTGTEDPIAGPNGVIVKVTQILAVVAGFTSFAFLVWGGFKYVRSGGDSSAVSSAKSTITAALVGLVLSALAAPLVSFVIGKV